MCTVISLHICSILCGWTILHEVGIVIELWLGQYSYHHAVLAICYPFTVFHVHYVHVELRLTNYA